MSVQSSNRIRKFLAAIVQVALILTLCFGPSGALVVHAQQADIPMEPPASGSAPVQGQAWSQSGWFSITWGDSQKGESQTIYTLTDGSSRTTRLSLDESLAQSLGGVLQFNRKYVSVQGVLAAPLSAQGASTVINVTSVSLASSPAAQTTNGNILPSVNGSWPWVTIMCQFSDHAEQPRDLAYFQGMYASTKPGLDHYWRELSYDNVNVAGSSASGWFVLPYPEAYYNPSDTLGGTDLPKLANDCTAAADASVDFSPYRGINMMFNTNFDNGYAWGGNQYMTLDGVTKSWSITWEPPWGYADISVIAHEMGHGFGLPHSSGNYGQTYDNAWDVMSEDRYNCAAAFDPTYGCMAQHTIAYHLDILGWIPAGQKYTVGPDTNATITLEQLALPQTGNYKMVQIPINGSNTHFYTVEARRLTGYDVKLAGNAVVIHEVDTTRGIPAHVIDVDGNGNTADAGAMWTVGETFSDPANGISVTVVSATATGFQITFTTPHFWTISGHVRTNTGVGVSGVTMNGLPHNPTTDADGYYSDQVANGWSGTVTPQKTIYTFNPPNLSYTNVTSDQGGQDYTDTYHKDIYYVKPAASGSGDCSNWDNACTLQNALSIAINGEEIWVAAGTYTPGTLRTDYIQLISGVGVFGGFAGTENNRADRNPAFNVSILSGDIGVPGDNSDNSYHIVAGADAASLDGFTISGANPGSGYGGGMYNHSCSPTLSNIIFSGNTAGKGSGMYNYGSNPTLTNVTFSGNTATNYGGGIYNYLSSPTLTDVNFDGNSAVYGGGMYDDSSTPTMTNIMFDGNNASYGGGLYNAASSPTLLNITFNSNTVTYAGAGLFNSGSSPSLTNVTFTTNVAINYGGGVFNYNSSPIMTNVTFSGNQASFGAGMQNDTSNPVLTNVTFSANTATYSGGGIYSYSGNQQIRNTILWGNTSSWGGQIYDEASSSSVVSDSVVQDGFAGGTNIIASDPMLGTPGDYGGFTQTIPLLTGSSAIDTGNDAVCPASDQRGVARPHGAHCDIGAFENNDISYILFAKPVATGSGDCQSWENACLLQDALAAAIGNHEIWVAAGTYKPTTGTDRGVAFKLNNGVAIYGGFTGTETAIGQRDPSANPTILSGDIGTTGDNSDNSYNVVIGSGTDATAILDGFTITGGNADGSSPNDSGGGMYIYSGSPTVRNVIFSANSAGYGGGMKNYSGSSPTLLNVIFTGNSAYSGGGMDNDHLGNPALTNVTFDGNSASYGGGMRNNDASNPVLANVTFSGNPADYGGGMFNSSQSSPTLKNVTFGANSATVWGGGMYNNNSSPIVRNSILWGNTAPGMTQIYNTGSSSLAVSDSVVQGGYGYAGGSHIVTTDPMLGPLGDYGGFTQTIPLLPGSSAIDSGDDATCAPTDQRGIDRPQGVHCDIGAFEVVNTPPTVDLSNPITILPEDTNTSSAIKVADIVITDDAIGANVLNLSGADAALFEIIGGILRIRAGTALDFETNPILDVTVEVDDSTIAGGPEDSAALAITVTNVNEAPLITSNGGGASASLPVTENSTAVTTVIASDPDAGATQAYSISGGADAALFTINATSGVLAFASAPNFESPTDVGGNNIYDVTVQVSDGSLTDSQAIAITVTDVNEAPVIISNGGGASASVSAPENSTAVTTVAASDPDAGAIQTYSIIGGADAARFTINALSGVLVFTSAPNFENPTDAGVNNVYDVTVQVSDGSLSDSQAIAVTITNVNEAPVITGQSALSTPKNTPLTILLSNLTVTDVDNSYPTGFTLTILAGVNYSRIGTTITPASNFTGTLTVPVKVNDGALDSNTFNLTVTVSTVNNPPVITSNGGGATASLSVPENSAAVTTVTAADPDAGATQTYSISGGADAARFTINAASGVLAFTSAPNFESPADADANNIYSVVVQVSDGSLTDSQAITVAVINVNEAPVILSDGGGASAGVSVPENSTAVTTVTAMDPDAGATQAYSISAGADAALFTINATSGVLAFVSAPNFETPMDSGGNNIYDVTIQVSDGSLIDNQAIAVTVTDVNEAPSVTLTNTISSLAENADTGTAIKVADIIVTDDALGTNVLSLSGADAALFEILGSELRLKAGTVLDFGTNPILNVTVQVNDASIGSNPDDSDSLAIQITAMDETPPFVLAIIRTNSNPSGASAVHFTVTFSEAVTGVDTGAFGVMTTGVTGASVTGVSGSGSLYTVTVNTGSGNGTIRLDVPSSADITDLSGNPLAGKPYTGGEVYIIIKGFAIYLPVVTR